MSRKNKVHVTMRDWRSGRGFGKEKARLEALKMLRRNEVCKMMQKKARRCCDLAGVVHEDVGDWLLCHMPSGAELVVYGRPTLHVEGVMTDPVYGHVVRTVGENRVTQYIVEPVALRMYGHLCRKAVELEEKYGRNGR